MLMLAGCGRKEKEPDPVPAGESVSLAFGFHVGGDSFDPQVVQHDGAGHAIRLGTLRFIASGFVLRDAQDQVVAAFPQQAILADAMAGQGPLYIGRILTGAPEQVRFFLGLDSAMNHANPLSLPYPFNAPGLHWDWNPAAGFKFLELEGHVDGNGDGDFDDAEDQVFAYHCATDTLLRADSVSTAPQRVNGAWVFTIPVDVALLLQELDLLAVPVAMGAAPECALAMDNLVVAVGAP